MDVTTVIAVAEGIIGISLGINTFFLRRTVGELDNCRRELAEVKASYATRSEMDACSKDISKIKENYITRQDFFQEQAKTDRKLDKIMDILMDLKGGK